MINWKENLRSGGQLLLYYITAFFSWLLCFKQTAIVCKLLQLPISLQVCGQEGVLKLLMVSTCGLPFETCVCSIYENNLYTVLFKDFKGLVCQSSQLWQGSVLEDLHLVWVSAEGFSSPIWAWFQGTLWRGDYCMRPESILNLRW